MLKNRSVGKNLSSVFNEIAQQIKQQWRKMNHSTANGDAMLGDINLKVASNESSLHFCPFDRMTPKLNLHPGMNLPRTNWLDNKIISTSIQCLDLNVLVCGN